ncbi:MAG: AsmA family protein [Acidobacteriia bacterium]|nr:AsmA family protein [Terriglobia bacterium]
MRFLRSRRGVLTLSVLLLLVLFLVRPGANHLQARIVGSISMALGRPVEVTSVHLRLLPQPGFDLENFVVHEDPAFGAEPMLRAQEVTASLRVTSLLRGRLEIASLSLTEPSLNLVRNAEGHWNLENLVERAERNPVAPTSKGKTETRPGFPYIEAQRGRINFKLGPEKKHYALTGGDFALWQDSENTWGLRLKAQPVRTDFNLSDTGIVQVNGSWQRATILHNTPVQFDLQWEGPQLGQLTKLAYGNDKGWRGSVRLSATIAGTPGNLTLRSAASVDDFRRYDVMGGSDLRLAVECKSHYSSMDNTLSDLSCLAPVGNGVISVAGRIANPLASPGYDLAVIARDLPLQSLVALVRHAKLGIPDDLVASGQVSATMKLRRSAQPSSTGFPAWEGGGETSGFHLGSSLTQTDLALDGVPFHLATAKDTKSRMISRALPTARSASATSEDRLDVGPFRVLMGKQNPILVRGWISRSGYSFQLQGEAQLQRLLQAARTVGLPVLQTAAEGSSKIDLEIAGGWVGFAAAETIGKVQLHSIRAPVRGLHEPVEISSANLVLSPGHTNVQNLNATLAGTSWRGSLLLPRPCVAGTCAVSFDLHADEIAVERLNQVLNPGIRPQPWYRFLSPSSSASAGYLLGLNAVGKLTADRILVGKLAGSRLAANVELHNGKLQLSDLHADVLGGKHIGEWNADFTTKPPQYSGLGTVERLALSQLATTMNSNWITGSAKASYRVNTSGLTTSELLASAGGTLQLDAWDGGLPRLVLTEGAGPLQMHRLTLHLLLKDGRFEIQDGRLETGTGRYLLSGTASPGRSLNLKLTRDGAPGFNITGTLTDPHVSQIVTPEARAALKP